MFVHATDVHFVRRGLGETQVEFAHRFAKSTADVVRWERDGMDFSREIDQETWRQAEAAARQLMSHKKGSQAMRDAKPACGNCRFFVPESGAPVDGFCRRFPPKVEAVITTGPVVAVREMQGYSLRTLQPPVEKGYWCGEYRRTITAADETD